MTRKTKVDLESFQKTFGISNENMALVHYLYKKEQGYRMIIGILSAACIALLVLLLS